MRVELSGVVARAFDATEERRGRSSSFLSRRQELLEEEEEALRASVKEV